MWQIKGMPPTKIQGVWIEEGDWLVANFAVNLPCQAVVDLGSGRTSYETADWSN